MTELPPLTLGGACHGYGHNYGLARQASSFSVDGDSTVCGAAAQTA